MKDPTLLIGCGILAREVRALIKKNGWSMETVLFDPQLHNDYGSLEAALSSSLATHQSDNAVVFYGCCHPRMDDIVAGAATIRTHGQNCIEMLLGRDVFTRELESGAFFLLESFARNWHSGILSTLGTDQPEIIQAIFGGDHRYILALRTPCSGDFTRDADEAGRIAGLPVRWMDVSLDHLELTLDDVLNHHPDESPA